MVTALRYASKACLVELLLLLVVQMLLLLLMGGEVQMVLLLLCVLRGGGGLVLFCSSGDGGILFRENTYDAGGYFVMNNRFVVFADNVDSEFLQEGQNEASESRQAVCKQRG